MQIIYIASIIIQLIAGILAIIYIKKTPYVAWLFIALSLSHMVFKKLLSSMGFVMPAALPEIIGSIFILWGVLFLHRILKQYNTNITQLKSLCDIDCVMLSKLSHKGILNAIVDKLNATLNTDAAAVLTITKNNGNNGHNGYNGNHNGPIFNTFASYNLSRKFQFYIQTRSNGFVSSVIENRKPLIISKIHDDENEDFLKTLRSEGFRSYMCAPIIIKDGMPTGVLTLYSKKPRRYTKRELDFVGAMSGQIAMALDRTKLIERIQETSFESVRALVEAIEVRDPYTRGHSNQVADLSLMIGTEMGFTERELTMMEFAGLLHDVGKIAVPQTILMKKDKLTVKEWNIIKKHPLHSVKIIEPVNSLEPIQKWILYHHERWDGNGYPLGKKDSEIPLQSRILAICDTYSAMTGDRPYRKGLSVEETKKEIERVAGTQLDPSIVDIFLKIDLNGSDKRLFEKIKKFRKQGNTASKALNILSLRKPDYQLRFL